MSRTFFAKFAAALFLSSSAVFPQALGLVDTLTPAQAWERVSDSTILEESDEVFAGSTFRCLKSCQDASIKVGFFDGNTWSKVCTNSAPCQGSYPLPRPDSANKKGPWALATEYGKVRPKVSPVFTVKRDPSAGQKHTPPYSSVIAAANFLTLKGVLADLPPATYQLHITAVEGPGGTTDQTLVWPGKSAVPWSEGQTGIFALNLTTASGQPVGRTAAILVTSKDGYQRAKREFDQATKLADAWRTKDLSVATVHNFLVSAIYLISEATQ